MDGWIYVKFLSKVNLSPAGSRWFHLIGVHLDWRMLHCHLEVIAQQGHFGKKSRAQNGKKYGQRYYRTLIGSRMLFCPIESSSITLEHVSRSNHTAYRRRHAPPVKKTFCECLRHRPPGRHAPRCPVSSPLNSPWAYGLVRAAVCTLRVISLYIVGFRYG